jgi:hypothetical protein
MNCPHCNKPIAVALHRADQGPYAHKYDHDQALALLRFGATVTEVAKTFGVTTQAISYLKRTRIDGQPLRNVR